MKPNDGLRDPGYPFMTLDLVTQILSMASKPSEAGEYLTEQLREFTGAKTVAIIESRKETSESDQIVSVDPERRKELIESDEVAELIEICYTLDKTTAWQPTDKNKPAKLLKKLGLKLSMAVPLKFGNIYVGMILLLDMPEEQFMDKVVQMLDMISTAAALILRNSFLYREQELLVTQRTQQLTASEQQLLASNQQLLANEQQLQAANQQLMANEKEREKLLKTLITKNKELQSIVYIATHDLRSPLVNIQGFAGELAKNCNTLGKLLEQCEPPEDIKQQLQLILHDYLPESVRFINSGTVKMKSLLDGLLLVSRVGTAEIDIQRIEMNCLIENIIDTVKYQIEKNQVIINIKKLDDCMGDQAQINQIFSNLIDNALKYLDPDRKCQIDIYGRTEGTQCIYCVEDTGIGISKQHQNKIFELFHRLDPSNSTEGEGIGLTIIKRILDRHNGDVWVESEPNKGSKFFISLPKAK